MSKWQGPLIIQDVYPSGAIRLQGDMKGKPHVVNGQRLKHCYAGEKFVGKIEEFDLLSPEEVIAAEFFLPESSNSKRYVSGPQLSRNHLEFLHIYYFWKPKPCSEETLQKEPGRWKPPGWHGHIPGSSHRGFLPLPDSVSIPFGPCCRSNLA